MRRMTRGLVAALEEEQIAVAAQGAASTSQPDETLPLIDHSDSVETDLIEITDTEAAAAQVDEQTEQAVDVAHALESMSLCLKNAAANGGLSKDGAMAVTIATDALCRQVGITNTKKRMPSLESYGTVSSRVSATQLAMENLKDQAVKIWRAIVEAIKKSINWLIERWNMFFNVAGKLKKRAEDIGAAAGKAQGEAKNKEIDDKRLVKALHVGGKVDGFAAHLDKVVGVTESAFKGTVERAEKLTKAIEAKSDQQVWMAFMDAANAANTSGMPEVTNAESEGLPRVLEGVVLKRGEALPGNRAFFAELPKDLNDKVKAGEGNGHGENVDAQKGSETTSAIRDSVQKTKFYLGDHSPKSEPADGTKLATLNPADVKKVAETVAKMAGAIEAFNNDSKKISEAKKKLMTKAEEYAKQSETAGDDEQKAEAKAFRELVPAVSKMVDSVVSGTSVYVLNTGKSALDYCAASLKEYGVEVAKADAKPEEKKEEPKKDDKAAAPAADAKPAEGEKKEEKAEA